MSESSSRLRGVNASCALASGLRHRGAAAASTSSAADVAPAAAEARSAAGLGAGFGAVVSSSWMEVAISPSAAAASPRVLSGLARMPSRCKSSALSNRARKRWKQAARRREAIDAPSAVHASSLSRQRIRWAVRASSVPAVHGAVPEALAPPPCATLALSWARSSPCSSAPTMIDVEPRAWRTQAAPSAPWSLNDDVMAAGDLGERSDAHKARWEETSAFHRRIARSAALWLPSTDASSSTRALGSRYELSFRS